MGECTDAEKVAMALKAAIVSAESGNATVLGLAFGAVSLFRNADAVDTLNPDAPRLQDLVPPPPPPPVAKLAAKLEPAGVTVLACQTCVKARGLDFSRDLPAYVQRFQLPDLMRMVQEARGSLQYW